MATEFDYPLAPLSAVTNNYFGTILPDLYSNLEDLDDPRTTDWLAAQIQLTDAYYANIIKQRQTTRDRLTRLWHYPKYSVLSKEAMSYFFWGLDLEPQGGVQNQAVLYRQDSLTGTPVSVIDPNLLDHTGNSAVIYQSISRDGQLVAFTVSKDGSDEQTVRIRHTVTLFDYTEVLEGCKTVNIAWKADNSGFFYNRFVASPGSDISQNNLSCIFWHEIGTPQSEDKFIFAPENTDLALSVYPETSYDGQYLVLYITHSTEPHNQILYRAVNSTAPFRDLTAGTKGQFVFIGSSNDTLYFQTTWQAPRGQIIAVDLAQPQPQHWQVLVPEHADSLAFVSQARGKLVAGYLHSAYHRLKIYNLEGIFEGEIEIPPFTTISGLTGKPNSSELFISLESFTSPPTVYRYDFEKEELTQLIKPAIDFQSAEYETSQVFFPSKDGTLIPMFLTHKKGICLDKSNPTLLTGYGGFGISETPIFLISHSLWLEQGGVLAVVNVRGGGEFGSDWHEQGRLAKKQNTFTDFCAAAEWLIDHHYTSPARLAIMGHSNGGLSVAGCVVQAPALFGAVICRAPLTDMLRYHLVGAGRNWLAEYGSADATRPEFEVLYAYSPLHNVRKAAYPAILVTVPIGDKRVHPMHSLKFIAGLQANSTGESPILLRVESEGGHGQGNSSSRTVDELCDIYTFLFSLFEMI